LLIQLVRRQYGITSATVELTVELAVAHHCLGGIINSLAKQSLLLVIASALRICRCRPTQSLGFDSPVSSGISWLFERERKSINSVENRRLD